MGHGAGRWRWRAGQTLDDRQDEVARQPANQKAESPNATLNAGIVVLGALGLLCRWSRCPLRDVIELHNGWAEPQPIAEEWLPQGDWAGARQWRQVTWDERQGASA